MNRPIIVHHINPFRLSVYGIDMVIPLQYFVSTDNIPIQLGDLTGQGIEPPTMRHC